MMKLLMMTGAAAALALTIGASAAHAGDKRDGADDLPTNPLACDSSGGGTVAAKPYDGGQPTGAPNKAGKEITLVDVPKLIAFHKAHGRTLTSRAEAIKTCDVIIDFSTPAASVELASTLLISG